MAAGAKRIEFAHVLRGIAALSVVVSHYTVVFWTAPVTVAALIGAPPIPLDSQRFAEIVNALLPAGFFGHFGVALFFLISGFVIPFGLLDRSRTAFAITRVFRLWPTYAVGLSLTAAFVWACSAWFSRHLPYETRTYLLHLLFVQDLFGAPSLDGIAWTLEIEVRFYLVVAILAGALREGRLRPVLLTAMVLSGVSAGVRVTEAGPPQQMLALSAQMICYMLIGTVLNYLQRGRINRRLAAVCGTFLFSSFASQWGLGVLASSFVDGVTSYGVALGVFVTAFAFAKVFEGGPAIWGWIANISYPLYVVHGVAGYVVIRVFMELGMPPLGAVGIAVVYALITAWLLHLAVEIPSHRFGRRLGRALDLRRGLRLAPVAAQAD